MEGASSGDWGRLHASRSVLAPGLIRCVTFSLPNQTGDTPFCPTPLPELESQASSTPLVEAKDTTLPRSTLCPGDLLTPHLLKRPLLRKCPDPLGAQPRRDLLG